MSKLRVGKNGEVKKTFKNSNSYFALKSQNELYYQMASIFKAVTKNEDKLEQKVFYKVLSGNSSDIYLENLN